MGVWGLPPYQLNSLFLKFNSYNEEINIARCCRNALHSFGAG
jgi:hypothetical protein